MPIVQHQLSFARPLAARVRSVRRPFRPSAGDGPYRLPHDLCDRLTMALAPFRNREAAFTLATFIARFWSAPGRVAGSFPIDRRALADHEGLGLTEGRVRGAIRTLEAVGFLERALLLSSSRYKATEHGLHRKPILFVFGTEYAPLFRAANKRVRAARGADLRARRPITPAAFLGVRRTNSPKNKSEAKPQVIMGNLNKEDGLPPEPSATNPLDLALERLRRAIGLADGG